MSLFDHDPGDDTFRRASQHAALRAMTRHGTPEQRDRAREELDTLDPIDDQRTADDGDPEPGAEDDSNDDGGQDSRTDEEIRVENAVLKIAPTKQIRDPEAAARLIDPAAIDFDDHGNPTNLDHLLDDLLDAKPWLKVDNRPTFRGGADQGSDGDASTATDDIVDRQRERVARMHGIT